jgi:hypothetical protein
MGEILHVVSGRMRFQYRPIAVKKRDCGAARAGVLHAASGSVFNILFFLKLYSLSGARLALA